MATCGLPTYMDAYSRAQKAIYRYRAADKAAGREPHCTVTAYEFLTAILAQTICPLCDRELKWRDGKGAALYTTPVLDRMDDRKSHTPSNCGVICRSCNYHKMRYKSSAAAAKAYTKRPGDTFLERLAAYLRVGAEAPDPPTAYTIVSERCRPRRRRHQSRHKDAVRKDRKILDNGHIHIMRWDYVRGVMVYNPLGYSPYGEGATLECAAPKCAAPKCAAPNERGNERGAAQ